MGGPKCGGNKSRLRGRISLTSGAIDMRRLLKNIRLFKCATKNQWWWFIFNQLTNNFCSIAWRRCWGQGSGGSRNGWDRVPDKDPDYHQVWPFQVQFEISRLVSVQTYGFSVPNQIKNARTRSFYCLLENYQALLWWIHQPGKFLWEKATFWITLAFWNCSSKN